SLSAGIYACAVEPNFQRLLCGGETQGGTERGRIRTDAQDFDEESRRQNRDQDQGQWNRHPARGESQNVQPVLHHQARRRGDWSWSVSQRRYCRETARRRLTSTPPPANSPNSRSSFRAATYRRPISRAV